MNSIFAPKATWLEDAPDQTQIESIKSILFSRLSLDEGHLCSIVRALCGMEVFWMTKISSDQLSLITNLRPKSERFTYLNPDSKRYKFVLITYSHQMRI